MDGQDDEFVVTRPDGSEETELYEDPSEVIARSVDVMRGLIEEGWRSPSLDAAAGQ